MPPLEDSKLDVTKFEEGLVLSLSDGGSTQIYRRQMDGALAIVKSVSLCVAQALLD
jgi:hypothetical protein